MACWCIMSISLFVIAVLFLYRKIKKFFTIPEVPNLENTWWGSGDPKDEDATIRPFKIEISEQVLKDLRQRLENALPFQKPLEDAKQHYGMNTNLLNTIVEYWKTEYDWRKREEFLNQYPQFKVSIQGLGIHFLHVKPENNDGLKVFPLLLLHGWPGSVREFYEIIPLLTKRQSGRDFVFEVIAPSLPGFGFSDSAVRKGLGTIQMAVIFANLMEKLGHKNYYIQGGDWGAAIISHMAVLYPNRVRGLHTNMPFSQTPKALLKLKMASYFPKLFLKNTEDVDAFNVNRTIKFWESENAYYRIQATKPDTVGVGLGDSPVGLAAYILEKFTTWTNFDWRDLDDGGLTKKFSYTNLLDNVMIYWVSRCITTSLRIYKEHSSPENLGLGLDRIPIQNVPCGCSRFFYDIFCYPESILREKYKNLVHITFHANGGHFAAFECPSLLATDIYDFVEKAQRT